MVAILNEKSNKRSLEYFWYLSTYKQRAVIGAGGLCSKFCSMQPYNLDSIRLGTLRPRPRSCANTMVRLQQSVGAKATTGFSLLPLPACHGAGPLWAILATMSPNLRSIKSHQKPFRPLTWARSHNTSRWRKHCLFTTAAGPEEEVCPPRWNLGGLPHIPLPSLVYARTS